MHFILLYNNCFAFKNAICYWFRNLTNAFNNSIYSTPTNSKINHFVQQQAQVLVTRTASVKVNVCLFDFLCNQSSEQSDTVVISRLNFL